MSDADSEARLEKAEAFFQRAEEVASTDNFDYAIEMYLDGLRRAPEALEDGHIVLRRMALIRQGKGGKKPSVVDKMCRRGGKSPLEEMLNAEYLLTKDPDHLPYAEAMLKACVAGGYKRTAEWIAQLVFDANRAREHPSLATYLLLKDSYAKIEMFSAAVAACRYAAELKPDDAALRDELRDLSARMTVQKGKYGQDGDFRHSILDRERQERLQSQESMIKSPEFRAKAVEQARKEAVEDPDRPANILKLADALSDMETDEAYEEAMRVLQQAYEKSGNFVFKRREGELRIKKLRRDLRAAKAAADADSDNQQLKQELGTALHEFADVELRHYRLCVENYPTDLKMKYEYGLRLLLSHEYDQAIPLFQEAQRDPRYKLVGMDKTGICFFLKGWFADAIDIFARALGACEVQDSDIAKDLRYNLARSYEEDGKKDKALEFYRRLAQLDFNYKDVSRRVDKLRKLNE